MTYALVFVLTLLSTYSGLEAYRHWQRHHPTIVRVYAHLQRLQLPAQWLAQAKEADLEPILHKYVDRLYPGQVQRQVPVVNEQQGTRRERIDLDIANGKIGIEIKLAKSLRATNERNRLIGQIQLYTLRRYQQQNLIVLIVGEAHEAQLPAIQELKALIEKDGNKFLFLAVI
jgi:hypothetical protein